MKVKAHKKVTPREGSQKKIQEEKAEKNSLKTKEKSGTKIHHLKKIREQEIQSLSDINPKSFFDYYRQEIKWLYQDFSTNDRVEVDDIFYSVKMDYPDLEQSDKSVVREFYRDVLSEMKKLLWAKPIKAFDIILRSNHCTPYKDGTHSAFSMILQDYFDSKSNITKEQYNSIYYIIKNYADYRSITDMLKEIRKILYPVVPNNKKDEEVSSWCNTVIKTPKYEDLSPHIRNMVKSMYFMYSGKSNPMLVDYKHNKVLIGDNNAVTVKEKVSAEKYKKEKILRMIREEQEFEKAVEGVLNEDEKLPLILTPSLRKTLKGVYNFHMLSARALKLFSPSDISKYAVSKHITKDQAIKELSKIRLREHLRGLLIENKAI